MIFRAFTAVLGRITDRIVPYPLDAGQDGIMVGNHEVKFVMAAPPPRKRDMYRWLELDKLGWTATVCPPPDAPAEAPALVYTSDAVTYLPGVECIHSGRHGSLVTIQPDAVLRTEANGLRLEYLYHNGVLSRAAITAAPGGNLAGAVLAGLDLAGADLTGVDLSGACLREVNFRDANLTNANLRGADIRAADLTDALLVGSRLDGAILDGAVLDGADARFARFTHARLVRASLDGTDMRWAWLDQACLDWADAPARWTGARLDWASAHGARLELQTRQP